MAESNVLLGPVTGHPNQSLSCVTHHRVKLTVFSAACALRRVLGHALSRAFILVLRLTPFAPDVLRLPLQMVSPSAAALCVVHAPCRSQVRTATARASRPGPCVAAWSSPLMHVSCCFRKLCSQLTAHLPAAVLLHSIWLQSALLTFCLSTSTWPPTHNTRYIVPACKQSIDFCAFAPPALLSCRCPASLLNLFCRVFLVQECMVEV